MARIIENSKLFKVIEVSAKEMMAIGCDNICDHCGERHFKNGFYVAVLNRWFCPECYCKWFERATYYFSDAAIERKNFSAFADRLRDIGALKD